MLTKTVIVAPPKGDPKGPRAPGSTLVQGPWWPKRSCISRDLHLPSVSHITQLHTSMSIPSVHFLLNGILKTCVMYGLETPTSPTPHWMNFASDLRKLLHLSMRRSEKTRRLHLETCSQSQTQTQTQTQMHPSHRI